MTATDATRLPNRSSTPAARRAASAGSMNVADRPSRGKAGTQALPPRARVSRTTAAISRALPVAGAVFSAAMTSGSSRRRNSAPGLSTCATVASGPARSSDSKPANSLRRAPGTLRPGASTHQGSRPALGRTTQRRPVSRSMNGNIAAAGPPTVPLEPTRRKNDAMPALPDSQR